VEDLIDWMLTSGRQRGGPQGSGLGLRSVRLTLGRFRAALDLAVRRQWTPRNVAEHVRISREAKRKAEAQRATEVPWDEKEVRTFLTAIREDRRYAAMMLALVANRPAEVCGVRWRDVDLDGKGTITVDNTRTIVYDRKRERGERNKVVEQDTKTAAGKRTLPLPSPVRKALRDLRTTQAQEAEAAGPAYSRSATSSWTSSATRGRPTSSGGRRTSS
jgi:integrase